jgi:hypothetical protein
MKSCKCLLPWACYLVLYSTPVTAQTGDTQQQMHTRVMALYNFSPHTISDTERQKKSDEMDAFWNDVKSNPGTELPLLRAELKTPGEPAFFYQDGSGLLLSLSHDKDDGQLAADAMAKADLDDVTPSAYFYGVHMLSMQGIDTTTASLHILDDPRFVVYVPQHAMTLNKPDCLMFLLLPVESSKWMASARSRFANSKDEDVRSALLTLFFYSQTPDGDAALQVAALDTGSSANLRKQASGYLQNEKEALKLKTGLTETSEDNLRAERTKRLGAVSDEAMDDIQQMTARLIQLRSKAK